MDHVSFLAIFGALVMIAVPIPLPAASEFHVEVKTVATLRSREVIPGERWFGHLAEDLRLSNGEIVPQGTLVEGRVEQVTSADSGIATMTLILTRLGHQPVAAEPWRFVNGPDSRKRRHGRDRAGKRMPQVVIPAETTIHFLLKEGGNAPNRLQELKESRAAW
jgi:hypothetical protein